MGAMKVATLDGMDHYVYEASYTDANGATQKMVPDGYVHLLSPDADSRIHFARVEEVAFTIAKYFSKSVVKDDPSGLDLIVESDPLPVCHQPDANIYAKVY